MVLGCKQQGGGIQVIHARGSVGLRSQAKSQKEGFDVKALVAK